MKAWLIKFFVSKIFDALLAALAKRVSDTDNTLDDATVKIVTENKGLLIKEIKKLI